MLNVPLMMRAVVYRGANDLRLEQVPVPRIGPHELLVRVAACGVCPTDIKKIQYGTVSPPRIFGHETAGTVVRVGTRVRGFEAGERVALHHHVPCMECHACRHHAFAQCEQYKRAGITAGFEPAGGGFAEYVRVMPFVLPGVVKIPPRNSFEEGAMLEPVNTVLKAVKRLALLRGDAVLVAGQGPIGLMFTRLLQLRGARVLATDLIEERLDLAQDFGASWTRKVCASLAGKRRGNSQKPGNSTRKLHSQVQKHERPPTRLDGAILTVPSEAALRYSLQLVRGGGQVLLFAHTHRGGMTQMDLAEVCVDEKDVLGSYSSDITLQREVADLVFSRKLDVRRLVTHRIPLDRTAEAVELAARPRPKSLKVIVGPQY